MSWLIFSRTSDSKVLLTWLEASLVAWELAKRGTGEEEKCSVFCFLVAAGAGDAAIFRLALDVSPRMRFLGAIVATGMVMAV